MTPEQALELLDVAAGQAQLNRATHVQIQEAVRILSEAIKKPENERT